MQNNVFDKTYSSDPHYATYQSVRGGSQIPRINVFPYPFYFSSNPFSDEPSVNPRRAGWSPQTIRPQPRVEPDPYPKHCFQSACNTRFTDEVSAAPPMGAAAKSAGPPAAAPAAGPAKPVPPTPSDRCALNRCINLYR